MQIKSGEIGATVKGRIKGEQIIDYILRAKEQQTLVVILESGNRSCYFNVTALGEDAAMFVSSTSGSRFVGEAPKDGEYIVRVYLMRNAARREETAAYTINFTVAEGGKDSKATIPGDTPPTRYDASGKVQCSADKPTLDQWCDFRVVRDLPRKVADIWIAYIAFKSGERHLQQLRYEDLPRGGRLRIWGCCE